VTTKPLSCGDVPDLVESLLDGLLGAEAAARVHEHCAACPPCGRVLRSAREVHRSLRAISRLHASVSVEDRVMTAVRAQAARQRHAQTIGRRQRAVLGGVALGGVLGEAVAWVAVLMLVVPSAVRLCPASLLAGGGVLAHRAIGLFVAAAQVARMLAGPAQAVLRGLSLLLPSPATLAVAFVSLLLTVTFIAVRRDLRSQLSARGSR
jgi:anti-sigma factor RsiW